MYNYKNQVECGYMGHISNKAVTTSIISRTTQCSPALIAEMFVKIKSDKKYVPPVLK